MTQPKVKTVTRGGSRFYEDPLTGDRNPGVTSVIDMLPDKPLRYWATRTVAETAVDNIGSLVQLTMTDRAGAIDYLRRAPDRESSEAARIGSDVHNLFETMLRGEKPRVIPEDYKPYVEQFRDFLAKCEPEPILLEETVWDDEEGYAGSFDFFGVLHGKAAGPLQGKHIFMDYKTNRSGIYEKVALQLAGYRRAKHILRPDGSRIPTPKADAAAVLHVRPEGWALYPVETDTFELDGQEINVFDYFRALRLVFDWETYIKRNTLGRPVAGGGELGRTGKVKITKPKGR